MVVLLVKLAHKGFHRARFFFRPRDRLGNPHADTRLRRAGAERGRCLGAVPDLGQRGGSRISDQAMAPVKIGGPKQLWLSFGAGGLFP